MTPLRKRMLEDMQLRNFAPETQRNYLHHITGLARYYMTSPEHLTLEEIRDYQLYLLNDRHQSPEAVNQFASAAKFDFQSHRFRDAQAGAVAGHPHIHFVVPGGGLSPDHDPVASAHWIACLPGFFLPVCVLSRLFRRLFVEMHQSGAIAQGRHVIEQQGDFLGAENHRYLVRHVSAREGSVGPGRFQGVVVAGAGLSGRQTGVLLRPAALAGSASFRAPSRSGSTNRMGGLRQAALRRARPRAGIPGPLHAPHRDLQSSALKRRAWCRWTTAK